VWAVVLDAKVDKQLARLSSVDRQRILRFLHKRVATLEDPRSLGDALVGPLSGYWKYRVGDYRVIARLIDQTVTVYVVRIGNRREVYR
jgi:mRNA interferase RelE/StbE